MRRHNTEKAAAERLTAAGYDAYVATQEEYKVWPCGKRGRVERVVIPSVVFVRCAEPDRIAILKMPFMSRFMTDRAGEANALGRKPVATIPDNQIQRLRFMLGNSDAPVTFTGRFERGQRVRVVRGRLQGLEGQIVSDPDGSSRLCIGVDLLGSASLLIDPVNVEPIP